MDFTARLTTDERGCRVWTGYRDRNGYGRVKRFGRQMSAHRVAWIMANGPIPDGMHVCHRCDNPPCCSVEHLFLGSNHENMLDKTLKGRARGPRGEQHRSSRLTAHQVLAVVRRLDAGETQTELAREHGVSLSAIWEIAHGLSWWHVTGRPRRLSKRSAEVHVAALRVHASTLTPAASTREVR